MGDYEKRSHTALPTVTQVTSEPGDGSHVEMVCRLVEKKDVIGANEEPREVHAPSLAAGERTDLGVPIDIANKLRNDAPCLGIGGPFVLGHVAYHLVRDGHVVVEVVRLAEHADGYASAPGDVTVLRLEHVAYQLQERRLSVAVFADDSDAVSLVHADRDVVEDALAGPLVLDVFTAYENSHVGLAFPSSLFQTKARP